MFVMFFMYNYNNEVMLLAIICSLSYDWYPYKIIYVMYNLYRLKSTRDKPSFDSKDNYDFSNIFVLIPEAA